MTQAMDHNQKDELKNDICMHLVSILAKRRKISQKDLMKELSDHPNLHRGFDTIILTLIECGYIDIKNDEDGIYYIVKEKLNGHQD